MTAESEAAGAERRLARERRARREAETIAEDAIRQLHESVQALQRSQAVLDETTDYVVIAGIDGRIRYMNRALLEVLDLEDADVSDYGVADLLSPSSWARFQVESLPRLEEKGVWRGELSLVLPASGREIPVSQVLIGHRGIDGALVSMSSISRDISEQLAMEEQLTQLALHDPLTGLPNRRLFLDRLELAVARAVRSGDPLALLFMDIDAFKTVNDTYGHDAGDDLLIAVANRVVGSLRTSDTVCRLGGDEFCALSERVGDEQGAVAVAERIARAVSAPITFDGHQAEVTLSIGVVVATAASDGLEQLLHDADVAMYQAKRAGKARVTLFVSPAT